jgi:hypothetical protein
MTDDSGLRLRPPASGDSIAVRAGSAYTLSFSNTQDSFTHSARVDGVSVQASVVPEPGTWALSLAGLTGVATAARRRRER